MDEIIVEEGVLKSDAEWRHPEWFEDAAAPTGSLRPDPGTICPTCGEKTPNKNALWTRAWRKRQKERKNE